jgi:phenylacetate 2-hydroxylase
MIEMKLEEHLALLGVVPRSYTLAVIPLLLYLIYKVRLLNV